MRLAALAVFALAIPLAANAAPKAAKAAPAAKPAAVKPDPGIAMGDPKARVVVDEYASLSCSHCAAFNNEVFPEFKKQYVDTGKVRWVFHEMITPPVQVAAAGFVAARCALTDKNLADKYYVVIDSFFHRQADLYKTGDLKAAVMGAGADAGLGEDKVKACLEDPAQLTALQARVAAAESKGVNSTPTFFVDGRKAHEGEITLADLEALVTKPAAKPGKAKAK